MKEQQMGSPTGLETELERAPGELPPERPVSLETELALLRQANRVLTQESAMLRETLDTIEGAIVIYDGDRRFLFANRAYHAVFPHLPPNDELFGRKFEELLAMSVGADTVEDPSALTDPEAFITRRVADMERRRAVATETYNARPGRQAYQEKTGRWYLLRSRRTPSGNDVTLRVDITEQKRFELEAQKARDTAERANAMKSQFLASISHELRTPLNAVINFAHLLQDEIHGPLGAPQYAEYVRDISEAGAGLLSLINELLDLAKAEAGRLDIHLRPTDPTEVIAGACRTMQPEAAQAGIALNCRVASGMGRMPLDPLRLRQVLLNLIANSVKFGRSGGTIEVTADRQDDAGLRIVVQDDGIGIAGEDLARVFEPFARGADPMVEAQQGSGLGLPLARHLIELHRGTLTLESCLGSGTTATVTLPG